MKNMSKFLGIIILAVLIAFSITACNPSGSDDTPSGITAIGSGALTLTIYDGVARSSRNMVQGNNYELTIRRPERRTELTTEQDIGYFISETITVTVTNIVETGGFRTFTLSPVGAAAINKYGESFEITMDQQGNMIQLNGLKGSQTSALIPVGDNSSSLDGAWFLWYTSVDELKSNVIIINGDFVSFSDTLHNSDGTVNINEDPTFQRLNFVRVGNKLIVSNPEIWENGVGDNLGQWVYHAGQLTEVDILEQTPNTLTIEPIENTATDGVGYLNRINTN